MSRYTHPLARSVSHICARSANDLWVGVAGRNRPAEVGDEGPEGRRQGGRILPRSWLCSELFDRVFFMRPPPVPQPLKRRILQEGLRRNEERDAAFRRIIHSIPKGRVSSYGRVAMAAGYPLHHRAVAQLLRKETLTAIPWQRIVGANGQLRLKGEFADEQRIRLSMEGLQFAGYRINMQEHEHLFRPWEVCE